MTVGGYKRSIDRRRRSTQFCSEHRMEGSSFLIRRANLSDIPALCDLLDLLFSQVMSTLLNMLKP